MSHLARLSSAARLRNAERLAHTVHSLRDGIMPSIFNFDPMILHPIGGLD